MAKLQDLRWDRIISNGLYTFFTAFIATWIKDGAPPIDFGGLLPALIVALLTAGLAMSSEMKKETEADACLTPIEKKKMNKGIVDKLLLF